ncbi:Hydroxyacylglutathione hydrolase [Candidatus Burkholderia verschuerenii]|uniref:Hydroxyacylglutathione hydrolase n=1 Tax=Candidatus Burkholderia verschuerenii TaxID=242163 RepID=A0A0L0MDK3_9BURK|nr:hydroxyacylglutathione hydrolase [Candidatus Burkholderia verschuerenii]KND60376.1 Hydroxyacylglutathione hydrolase [Candidatus Burkholderia verschuerenii]
MNSPAQKALEYVPVPAFDDNYIWLVSDLRNAVVVDPGDAAPVEAYLAERGWRLTAILLTHHHNDHVGGVKALLDSRKAEGGVPVYGPAGERIDHLTQRLNGGDAVHIEAPAMDLTVIDVPWHTAGHIAYFQASDPAGTPHLFCGDTLFASGCGRLFEGTAEQMLHSLEALPEATQVHCAHEYTLSNIRFALACDHHNEALERWREDAEALRAEGKPTLPTTIGHEKAVNPFLRTDAPIVRRALSLQFSQPVGDRLTAFTLMSGWKDKFR